MCNHYRLGARDIQLHKGWERLAVPASYADMPPDIWPNRMGLVGRHEDGAQIWDTMTWGFPMTAPGKRPGTIVKRHVTNVRNLSSSFWKSTLSRPEQRCLVPFSSFAEPRGVRNPDTNTPAEYWFSIKTEPVAAFAGIWREVDGKRVYAFLTCEPNAIVAPLHPKAMPVILLPEDYERWLMTDYADACSMAVPYPSQLMTVD